MIASNEQTYNSIEAAIDILCDIAQSSVSEKEIRRLGVIIDDLNDILVYNSLRDD